jgi:hypothetical protein
MSGAGAMALLRQLAPKQFVAGNGLLISQAQFRRILILTIIKLSGKVKTMSKNQFIFLVVDFLSLESNVIFDENGMFLGDLQLSVCCWIWNSEIGER